MDCGPLGKVLAFDHELLDLPIPELYLVVGRYLDGLGDHLRCLLVVGKAVVGLSEVIVEKRFDARLTPVKTQRALDVPIHQHEVMPVDVVFIIKLLKKLLVGVLGAAFQLLLIGEVKFESLPPLDQVIDGCPAIGVDVLIDVLHHVVIEADPQQFLPGLGRIVQLIVVHLEPIILLQQLVSLLDFPQRPKGGRLVVVAPVEVDLAAVGVQQAVESLGLGHLLQDEFEIGELVELLAFLEEQLEVVALDLEVLVAPVGVDLLLVLPDVLDHVLYDQVHSGLEVAVRGVHGLPVALVVLRRAELVRKPQLQLGQVVEAAVSDAILLLWGQLAVCALLLHLRQHTALGYSYPLSRDRLSTNSYISIKFTPSSILAV